MRKRIEEQNLNVSITTDASDEVLAALYGSALALILPSTLRSEAFGMVQVEAMFCGTPVISTAIDTGVPWVNKDSVSGLIIEPRDSAALESAVRRLLDGEEWSRLSEGARERAVTLFDGEKLMSRIEGICMEVLDDWQNRS
jgi:rhamnosyl/mannosyltransferase